MIFIMARKFRLSLFFLISTEISFNISFFTTAIQYNSYDIAFYLLKVYEEQILQNQENQVKAIDAHIQAYKMSTQFLKAKLFMSKQLLNEFNFNHARSFLDVISYSIYDTSLEQNLFAHSSNPLLVMCMLYELLLRFMNKFLSLKKVCEDLMEKVLEMAIEFIHAIDDENFLNAVVLEKDYENRDILQIADELELLKLIQAPKVVAIIKGIYFSHYEQSGNIL